MLLAPGQGLGVLALANTGWFDPRGAPVPVTNAVLRRLLGLPPDVVRTDVPDRPEIWSELCGWYSFGPGVLTDPQPRMLGAGVEVVVRRSHLTIRGQMPIPAVRKGLRLHPDDDDDPCVFRIDTSALGPGTSRVVFSRKPDGAVNALHLGVVPMSLPKRPDARNPRPWVTGALAVGAAALALRRRHVGRDQ
jgi:hypothetical protein